MSRSCWSIRQGHASAADRLLPLLYDELHRLAESFLRHERVNHTLQPTALVHEAYLRMVRQDRTDWQNRAHFCAVAAQAMRRILLSHARDRAAAKRGGKALRVTLSDSDVAATPGLNDVDLLALDDALGRLAALDDRQARVVELRFFGGLTVEQAAEVLGVSPRSVKADWQMAKAWLYTQLKE
ncbi:MAG TPA: sigma-70 family RNA polymerase sigma factor [Phycisphaerales bacterium]|nr:sigma-70 family RNA polymerase sigma factor [Phycisphaerales bacterium]